MSKRPFTLVEVLVALVVAAVVIPVCLEALMTVGRLDESTANRRRAAELAAQKLDELVITGDWNDGTTSGDFGTDYPGFTWQVATDTWTDNYVTMEQVDLTVTGPARFGTTSVTLTTLVPEPTEE